MRSLRLRFFLIAWPIVVAAVLLVALGVERWATFETERREFVAGGAGGDGRIVALAARLGAAWPLPAGAGGTALLSGLVDSAQEALAVVDAAGRLVAASDPQVRIIGHAESPGGTARFEREHRRPDGAFEVHEIAVSGFLIAGAGGAPVGALYVLPLDSAPGEPAPLVWRAAAATDPPPDRGGGVHPRRRIAGTRARLGE